MSAARIGSLGNVTYKKQVDYDTQITTDELAYVETENFAAKPAIYKDNSLISKNVMTDDVLTGYEAATGTVTLKAMRPVNNDIVAGPFQEAAVSDPIKSVIVITNNGSNNYVRLSIVSTDMIAEKSTNGTDWVLDTDFCTTGTMDLTAAAYDTVAEVVTAIAGYTGYDCVLLGGTGSEASSNIPAFAVTTLKSLTNYIPLMLKSVISGSSTSKSHNLTMPTTEIGDCFTFLVNRNLGTNKSVAYVGMKSNQVSIKAEAGNPVSIECAMVGKKQAVDTNDVTVTPINQIPFVAAKAKIVLVDYATGTIIAATEVKSLNAVIGFGLTDGKYIGSDYAYEPEPQNYTATLDFSIANNSNNYGLKAIFDAVTSLQAYIYLGHITECDTVNNITHSMLLKISNIKLTDEPESTLSTRDKLFMAGKAEMLAPKNSENMLDFIITDDVTSTY